MSHNLVFFKVANPLAKKESLNTYSLVLKTSEKFDPPYLSDITLFTKSSRQKIHSFGFDLCLFEMINLCPYSIVSAFQTKLTALKLRFCFCKEYKNKQIFPSAKVDGTLLNGAFCSAVYHLAYLQVTCLCSFVECIVQIARFFR